MLLKTQQIHHVHCLENRGLVAKILGHSFANILEEGGQSKAQSPVGTDVEVELFRLLQDLVQQCLRETPE